MQKKFNCFFFLKILDGLTLGISAHKSQYGYFLLLRRASLLIRAYPYFYTHSYVSALASLKLHRTAALFAPLRFHSPRLLLHCSADLQH